MKRNFNLASSVEVLCDGQRLDMHNDFSFRGYAYDLTQRVLVLTWAPLEPPNANARVEFRFEGVTFLQIAPRDPGLPEGEDDCVSFIGFLHPEMDVMDAYLPDEDVEESSHMIFNFEGDWALKVYAARATLSF